MNEQSGRSETTSGPGGDAGGSDLRSGESSEASPSVSSLVGDPVSTTELGTRGPTDPSVAERLMDTGPSMGSDAGFDTETSVRSETLLESAVAGPENDREAGGTGPSGSAMGSGAHASAELERPELGQSEP